MFTLGLIGLVGGLITGISPCILPVLPVIFLSGGAQGARGAATEPEGRNLRPFAVIAGLALSFSIFTLLGTLVLSSLPVPQDIIRWAGLVVLVLLGVGMIVPRFEELLERPFSRIPQRSVNSDGSGFLLGLALGAVYVPCAGPVLAAITVAGATGRIGGHTVVLTVAFAIGTSLPLLVFALAGRRVAERVRRFRTHQRQIRVLAGVVVIALAVALTFNVTDRIQRAIPDYTSALNKTVEKGGRVAKALGSSQSGSLAACAQTPSSNLSKCGRMPGLTGIDSWLNTPQDAALPAASLKGKVVLVDFWAYSCINCQRAIPHDEAWYAAYRRAGLEVVGVHTPEYAFEHVRKNVAAGTKRLGITYPVALDNDYSTWNNFGNSSWPAEYLVDATGEIRHVAIGEGDYANTEALIRQLLQDAHPDVKLPSATHVADTTPTGSYAQTPETYLGGERANSYVGGGLKLGTHHYSYPASVPADEFALAGSWTIAKEALTAEQDAGLALNFQAKNVYLDVGGTGTVTATLDGKTKTYQVSGAPDIYTLVHGSQPSTGTLRITLSKGLRAYSFTFG